MNKPELIILYGRFGKSLHRKQQMMINGNSVCGYREYAEKFGHIVYLAPQYLTKPWERNYVKPEGLYGYLIGNPQAIIWSVKHGLEKDKILSRITSRRIYYSCCNRDMYNNVCDISLVDTQDRLKGNAKLHLKGKDPDKWLPLPESEKKYDYLLLGRRGDKNEVYFLNQLNAIQEKRKILWIGGEKHKYKAKTRHDVTYTPFVGVDEVRRLIPLGKVGILLTEIKAEGFPQSFIEMTICGLPVVYSDKGPMRDVYKSVDNCQITPKGRAIESAEWMLAKRNQEKCREYAINNYSLQKSWEYLKGL